MSGSKVSEVLSLTQEMMVAVIEQQWDVLLDMQARQDYLLKDLFDKNDLPFTDQDAKDLQEVQRLNREIIGAADSHKSEVAEELRAMRQGKVKANAYQVL